MEVLISTRRGLDSVSNPKEPQFVSENLDLEAPHISFAPDPRRDDIHRRGVYIPGPRERDGTSIQTLKRLETDFPAGLPITLLPEGIFCIHMWEIVFTKAGQMRKKMP